MVNRAKKSEYNIKRVKYTEKFGSVEDVRTELQSLDVATKDVGYIEPGHGVKLILRQAPSHSLSVSKDAFLIGLVGHPHSLLSYNTTTIFHS